MSLVREKVKAIVCLGVDNKKIIDVFGNVVDVVLEVTNMDDAVRMQRLTEKGDTVIITCLC
jgi:UDP-N-acetylmuramoylalanine--D-glutamate ligase